MKGKIFFWFGASTALICTIVGQASDDKTQTIARETPINPYTPEV